MQMQSARAFPGKFLCMFPLIHTTELHTAKFTKKSPDFSRMKVPNRYETITIFGADWFD